MLDITIIISIDEKRLDAHIGIVYICFLNKLGLTMLSYIMAKSPNRSVSILWSQLSICLIQKKDFCATVLPKGMMHNI